MSRLAALERSLGGRPVSPGELADALGITDPSGRRLVRKLTEAGLAVPDGSTQPHHKGRPARLYRLAITAALTAGRSPGSGPSESAGGGVRPEENADLPSASGDDGSPVRAGR
jgi:hypothetical protein